MDKLEKTEIERMLRTWGKARETIRNAGAIEREYRMRYSDRLTAIQGAGEGIERDSLLAQYMRAIQDAKDMALDAARAESAVNDVLCVLPKREKTLLYSLYADGLSVKCAGELMGYSERQTYNIKADMLQLLYDAYKARKEQPAKGDDKKRKKKKSRK